MGKQSLILLTSLALSFTSLAENPAETSEKTSGAVLRAMADSKTLEGVPFREVVFAATGCRVLSVDPAKDQEWLKKLGQVLTRVLKTLNDPSHAVQDGGRINEASRFIENELMTELNAIPGWRGSIPPTATQTRQRSGYPDLRLELEDKRVVYLDPKLHAADSRTSSFRAFYFEPKKETLKITEHAIHLLVSVSHSPHPQGGIRFESWELIDIADMPLRLKAEFQASNREIFEKSRIVAKSQTQASEP
ncbi:MAG: hypothetical protein WEB60_04335 [Terrimicrobiaceae bacterium]